MFAGQRKKTRFQVDIPTAAQPKALPIRPNQKGIRSTRRRHKTRRFHLSPVQPRRRHLFPKQVTDVIARLRRQHTATLAQRRQFWKGLLLTIVCVSLVAAVAIPLLIPLLRTYISAPSRATTYDTLRYLNAANAPSLGASPPFPSLEQHTSNTNRPSPDILAQSAFVFDPLRGWLFYQKSSDTPRPMASLTKLMTLLLAVEYGNLDQMVTVGSDAAALVNSNNSAMGLSAGERLSLRDLLYGLIVASGNDAAVAIADHVGGSQSFFVVQMNRRARQLGLTNTTIVSPDGADDGNRTSAHDLAILAAVALAQPEVQQITSTYRYRIAETSTHKAYTFTSGNDLLPGGHSPYSGANGVKTGYTDSAQYCIAFSAQVQGHLIVGVTLGDPSPGARMADASALLNWATLQES